MFNLICFNLCILTSTNSSFIFNLNRFALHFRYLVLGVNYQDIGFNGAGLSGSAVNGVTGVGGVGSIGGAAEQLGGLLAPVSVQNLAALAAMTQPVVTQAAPMAPATAPQPTAPQLCKYIIVHARFLTMFYFKKLEFYEYNLFPNFIFANIGN